MTIHKHGRGIQKVFEHQADATINQANPVSGTKYVILETTQNVRIISIYAIVTWTVQPTPLECHITIDGQSLLASKTDPASATDYRVYVEASTAALWFTTTMGELVAPFILEGRSVKIELEITGGTVSNLSGRVKYAKRV